MKVIKHIAYDTAMGCIILAILQMMLTEQLSFLHIDSYWLYAVCSIGIGLTLELFVGRFLVCKMVETISYKACDGNEYYFSVIIRNAKKMKLYDPRKHWERRTLYLYLFVFFAFLLLMEFVDVSLCIEHNISVCLCKTSICIFLLLLPTVIFLYLFRKNDNYIIDEICSKADTNTLRLLDNARVKKDPNGARKISLFCNFIGILSFIYSFISMIVQMVEKAIMKDIANIHTYILIFDIIMFITLWIVYCIVLKHLESRVENNDTIFEKTVEYAAQASGLLGFLAVFFMIIIELDQNIWENVVILALYMFCSAVYIFSVFIKHNKLKKHEGKNEQE